jgi:hypothetical protein
MTTKAALIAEREEVGDRLALVLGQLDALLDMLNADLEPIKRKSAPAKTKKKGK